MSVKKKGRKNVRHLFSFTSILLLRYVQVNASDAVTRIDSHNAIRTCAYHVHRVNVADALTSAKCKPIHGLVSIGNCSAGLRSMLTLHFCFSLLNIYSNFCDRIIRLFSRTNTHTHTCIVRVWGNSTVRLCGRKSISNLLEYE